MDRAERRRRLRELQKLRDEIAARGLPQATAVEHLAALTASLCAILERGNDAERASRAVEFLHGVVSRTTARDPATARLHCRKGCAYCCKNYVSATIPEVFALASAVRGTAGDLAAELARIRAAESATRGLGVQERPATQLPCALLVNDVCTAYERRPLVCRTYVSLDLAACERAFAGGADEIPMPPGYRDLRGACDQSLWAALHGAGLDCDAYELNHALLVALEEPDAQRRWLSGEPVFAGVRRDDSLARLARGEREIFWNVLLALSRGEDPPVTSWRAPGAAP